MSDLEHASLDAFIHSWLNTLTNPLSQHCQAEVQGSFCDKRKRDFNKMPTPPHSASTPTRMGSPAKRARMDDATDDPSVHQYTTHLPGDNPFDTDKTPNASVRGRTIPLYSLPPRRNTQTPSQSSTNASSHRSPSRASSNRSGSPVKQSTLELLKKPIRYTAIEDDPTEQLPDDIASLFDDINSITVHKENFLPSSLYSELEALHRKGTIRRGWYFEVGDDADKKSQYKTEFIALCDLEEAAKTVSDQEACEATWNLEVHAPLLKLAFNAFPSIHRHLLTSARISKPFLPEMRIDTLYDYSRPKMIDLGVRICPPPHLSGIIHKQILALPDRERCLNQTVYRPVRNDPIAMVIETKIARGDLEEARLQLGIWVASWHQRMKMLIGTSSDKALVTLPLIIVMEHKWRLLFACDKKDQIVILQDLEIGSTDNLIGLYTIVATLRVIGAWMQDTYISWLEETFRLLSSSDTA
ncbi:hypothetical protein FOXG_07062 [Fusarium oxysporum f. sp. lycopersici 4287]|uniref:PD-(D/E)XK nuclease-like domain-containing protein n=1 Tax=Fusarium oxysporum f. sp. lycopersici (strain 4287 / CBS 123668 / FGSC 9935 / NRRL 34936) TaxID=426428 RepID=A0A0J9V586_FUSO4|nr:hypothetical protein FOXG_07062 [Fusarium oxysporum f. sp. lycopersici 4287]KAJ9419637.1 hypothetical protein QL093DRAFT_2370814 [Fusarium oxysporum]KNB06308.1 hypothetical protein FOXG_07062 [Fusarium oxysporum f. sp. lycopersici 4287]